MLLAVASTAPVVAKLEWEPIAPADLAATECQSHPGASAEGLLIRTVLDSSGTDCWTMHYNQVKIYSPKGAEESGVLNIDYADHRKVWGLAARVTKPDGSARLFQESDFQDRVIARQGSRKDKRKALAVPGLEAGDVIDLQWRQDEPTADYSYQWWYARQRFPVRRCIFAVIASPRDFHLLWFGVNAKRSDGGNYRVTLEMDHLEPYDEEPMSLPERDVRSWYLMLYTHPFLRLYSNQDIWDEISSYREEEFRLRVKPAGAIRKQARELVSGAKTDEEKLARLYDFCRNSISNLDYFDSQELRESKKKLDAKDDDPSPDWTLEHHVGYRRQINQLFASLAKAEGFDVRVALSASRDVTLEVRQPMGWLFLDEDLVEVRLGQTWKPYAPGDYYIPPGMIATRFEFADSFRCERDKGVFEQNPVSPAGLSVTSRKGRFTLDVDGNLEGDVDIELGGHAGVARKKAWHTNTQQEIEDDIRSTVTEQLPAATLDRLTLENSSGLTLPVTIRYHLTVPGYADVAGSKIIVVPSVFEHGRPAIFTAEQREHPIMFDYAWAEHDDIEIQLPEGFMLDAPSAPANVGDPAGTLGVRYVVSYKGKTRSLIYHREFALGGNSATVIQAASYPALKEMFDAISRSDEHTIVLKPKPAPAPATTAAPAPAAR